MEGLEMLIIIIVLSGTALLSYAACFIIAKLGKRNARNKNKEIKDLKRLDKIRVYYTNKQCDVEFLALINDKYLNIRTECGTEIINKSNFIRKN